MVVMINRDFASDINLCIEIWSVEKIFEKTDAFNGDIAQRDDFKILLIGMGSAFFVLILYIANLIIAARIKSIIKHNETEHSFNFVQNLYIL